MFTALLNWVKGKKKHKPAVGFVFKFHKPKPKGIEMLSVTITNEQKIDITITPVTATGKPARLDGPPVWAVSSGDVGLSQSADGLTATLTSSDTPGDSVVTVTADADLGAGVETISDAVRLTVEGAKAVSLGLKASSPVPK